MAWFVVVYKSSDESVVKIIPTPRVDEELIRNVWLLSEDDPVIGASYLVTSDEVARMQGHIGETINLDAYIYELRDEED